MQHVHFNDLAAVSVLDISGLINSFIDLCPCKNLLNALYFIKSKLSKAYSFFQKTPNKHKVW